jgi:hypothetical protein
MKKKKDIFGFKYATSKLAGYGKRGKIWINPHVPKTFKGISMFDRLFKHEKVERQLRQKGLTYPKAHEKALKQEHEGLTRKQLRIYEGKLGAIARWLPRRKKRR